MNTRQFAGIFLMIEGLISIGFSPAQGPVSNLGRGLRMLVGLWLLDDKR